MTSLTEARATILASAGTVGTERIPLTSACGRVLAEPLIVPWDLPLCDNSAMDGFAVITADCADKKGLRVIDNLFAGSAPPPPLLPGCAVRIMTGAPVPPGADAILPLEDASGDGNIVTPKGKVVLDQHIRRRGEDFTSGSEAIPAGTLLRPTEISLLAACNMTLVSVFTRPRVAIVSTGDELVELGQTPMEGQIVNSNALALAAAIREAGAEPIIMGIARDNRESHRHLLAKGLKADALITSAGVSSGDCDLVREVLGELGVCQLFWKIAMKPGGPTAFGVYEGKPVFSLPGNPVSALLTFELLVRPALLRMQGVQQAIKPLMKGILENEVTKKPGKLKLLRVKVTRIMDGRVQLISAGNQKTGFLRTMLDADAIAFLAAGEEHFRPGDEVEILMLRDNAMSGK